MHAARILGSMLSPYVRWGFTFFFATHLLITLLLDVQALPIGDSFPEALKALIKVSAVRPVVFGGGGARKFLMGEAETLRAAQHNCMAHDCLPLCVT